MKKKLTVIAMVMLLVAAVLTLSSCSAQGTGGKTIYRVYFGMNDAATEEQAVNTEDAKTAIRSAITSDGLGYTEYEVYGGYPEDGTVKENVTLIYEIFDSSKEAVTEVIDKIKADLRLDSVFICEIKGEFYYA